jgi:hypothetical protein
VAMWRYLSAIFEHLWRLIFCDLVFGESQFAAKVLRCVFEGEITVLRGFFINKSCADGEFGYNGGFVALF